MDAPLYPLKFVPVYETSDGAGTLLNEYLSHDRLRDAPASDVGVSWELVDSDQVRSVVANGPAAGQTLSSLVRANPHELVGKHHSADNPFPLNVRLVDVGRDQALRVHPERTIRWDDTEAGPNTTFWISLAAEEGANVTVGIRPGVTRLQVLHKVNSLELKQLLQVFPARPGDAFFVPNRRMHSVGAGNLIWELRQTLAGAVRVQGEEGAAVDKAEQQAALDAIWFQDRQLGRISRETSKVAHTRKIPLLPNFPDFLVDEIRLYDHLFDRTDGTTFHLVGVTDGEAEIRTGEGTESLPHGSLCCLPAQLGDYRIYVRGEEASLVRVCMKIPTGRGRIGRLAAWRR